MKFKYKIKTPKVFETDSLREVVKDFYENGTGHLSIDITDGNIPLNIQLEVNDMEANIMIDGYDWTSYADYDEDVLDILKDEFDDLNALNINVD